MFHYTTLKHSDMQCKLRSLLAYVIGIANCVVLSDGAVDYQLALLLVVVLGRVAAAVYHLTFKCVFEYVHC